MGTGVPNGGGMDWQRASINQSISQLPLVQDQELTGPVPIRMWTTSRRAAASGSTSREESCQFGDRVGLWMWMDVCSPDHANIPCTYQPIPLLTAKCLMSTLTRNFVLLSVPRLPRHRSRMPRRLSLHACLCAPQQDGPGLAGPGRRATA